MNRVERYLRNLREIMLMPDYSPERVMMECDMTLAWDAMTPEQRQEISNRTDECGRPLDEPKG